MSDQRKEIGFRHSIDLVQDEDHGAGEFAHKGQSEVIFRSGEFTALGGGRLVGAVVLLGKTMCDVYEEKHKVARLEGIMDLLHHAAIQLSGGFVDAGSIDEDDLCGGTARVGGSLFAERDLQNSIDTGACRLRFVSDDCELLAKKSIEQGRLACVGAADDGDETGAKCHSPYYALGLVARGGVSPQFLFSLLRGRHLFQVFGAQGALLFRLSKQRGVELHKCCIYRCMLLMAGVAGR